MIQVAQVCLEARQEGGRGASACRGRRGAAVVRQGTGSAVYYEQCRICPKSAPAAQGCAAAGPPLRASRSASAALSPPIRIGAHSPLGDGSLAEQRLVRKRTSNGSGTTRLWGAWGGLRRLHVQSLPSCIRTCRAVRTCTSLAGPCASPPGPLPRPRCPHLGRCNTERRRRLIFPPWSARCTRRSPVDILPRDIPLLP